MSVKDVAHGIIHVLNAESRQIDLKRSPLDLTKAKTPTGYQPEHDLYRGIKTYIQWVCEVYTTSSGIQIIRRPNF